MDDFKCLSHFFFGSLAMFQLAEFDTNPTAKYKFN